MLYKIALGDAKLFFISALCSVAQLNLIMAQTNVGTSGLPIWLFYAVQLAIGLLLYYRLAEAFGKGMGFRIGMMFCFCVFVYLLAFGDAQYQPAWKSGNGAGQKGKKAARQQRVEAVPGGAGHSKKAQR